MAAEDSDFWGGTRRPRRRLPRFRSGRRERKGEPAGRVLTWITVGLAVATLIGLVVLWPGKSTIKEVPGLDFFKNAYKANVLAAASKTCPAVDPTQPVECVTLRVRLLEGPEEGTRVTLLYTAPAAGTKFSPGDQILVVRSLGGPEGPNQPFYSYLDHARLPSLWWLGAAFALAVVLLGRLHGLG